MSEIIKTTTLEGGSGGHAKLLETSDGKLIVHKSYAHLLPSTKEIDNELDTLVYLYKMGISVPKPISRDKTGFTMQYIDGGMFIDKYKESTDKNDLMKKFAKTLHDLHTLETTEKTSNFINTELSEIKQVIEKYNFTEYQKILNTLETAASHITEQPPCYIHRDYHAWNVLSDKNGKLYIIDLTLKQGDFRFDVGWTYMLMARNGENPGFSESFFAEYKKLNFAVSEDFEFFKQLANLRWLINVKPWQIGHFDEGWQWLIKQGEGMIVT